MSYQVFARKYRPQSFDGVIGQEHITRTLKNAIAQNRLAHAYLFVGPRGVGKTSTARILAKALNCVQGPTVTPCGECDSCREITQGNSLDVLEIDGASNNKVEEVRVLTDNVRYAPTRGKFKIYIIDEVHMLTSAAFNALLKTLEEPPEHVKFIFATTEPQKVLPTILSRCQRFDLRRIPTGLIARHLQFISQQEKIALDDCAAETIAKGAEGGLRDAESMLDQLVAFCGDTIAEEDVLSVFGFTAHRIVAGLCERVLSGDCRAALTIVQEQADAGKDLSRLMTDLISRLRDLLVTKADPDALKEELNDPEALAALQGQAEGIRLDRLLELIDQFAAAETRMKWAPNKRLHFEVAVIKAVQTLGQTSLTDVIETLAAIRNGGASSPAPAPSPRAVAPVARAQEQPSPAADKATRKPATATVTPPPAAPAASPAAAARPEPPTAAEAVPGDDTFWVTVLKTIRARRPLISSWIEAGALLKIDAAICQIGFPEDQAFAMNSILKPNTRKFVEEVLAEAAGRPLELRCETRAGLVVTPPLVPEENAHSLKDNPLIQKTLEMFKGEIQPA